MNLASSHRRRLLQLAAGLPLWPSTARAAPVDRNRVRPGDAAWPSSTEWAQLNQQVGGRLTAVQSPLVACRAHAASEACAQLFKSLKNPYAVGDNVALTQTLGWVDAWTSAPSVYAVEAEAVADVVAAVNFARERRLRLVVKGGGHSYQGTSNAPDSLLIWTRHMNAITLHDAFVARGCAGRAAPQRAVTVEAGAVWSQVYDAVTTKAGGYVQGGGCMSVGVAGLVQSGGFGSFSKRYGLAAASLLEAEVVTASGVLVANECSHPELFWGLKGGGGASLGVVTQLTLRVHPLPEAFGAVNLTLRAASPAAFRRLIEMTVGFYADSLMNPHWGEQIRIRPDDTVAVSMVFQGLTRAEALAVWQPFRDAIAKFPADFSVDFAPFGIVSTSAREFWSPTFVKRVLGFIRRDERPDDAAPTNVFWPGDQRQAGQFLHGYQSAWLPARLLEPERRSAFCDALFAASRHSGVSLHVNKGLAGATPEVLADTRDTAMNPAVLDAFALAISGAEEQPAYPGIAGHEPDVEAARRRARSIGRAFDELRRVAPTPGSYLAESDYFEADWAQAFWGANHARLRAVKARYDPDGLFFAHHGIGSDDWSADGFTRRA